MNVSFLPSVLLAVLAAASVGLATPEHERVSAAATSASGDGTMSFGHDEDGRGYFRFRISDGDTISGSLLFAAEDHHEHFPDVVVNLGTIDEASFDAGSVKFSGPGQLHDDLVTVRVEAYDRRAEEKADRFVIKCTDPSGETVFEADGELFRGDIVIGTE